MGSTFIKTLVGSPQETCPDLGFLPPTYDLNQDGYGDLVTAECHQEGGKEICSNYQVRLGLKKGGYADLFNNKTKSDPIKAGDTVYHSAKFYADNPLARSRLAEPIPYPVRLLGPQKQKQLTSEELKNLCTEQFKQPDQMSEKSACIGAAGKHPEEHSLQPQGYPEPLVYFEPPKKPEGAVKIKDLPSPVGPASPTLLVKETGIHLELFARSTTYPFLDFGMELSANVIARVQDRSSGDLGNYLFALENKAITPEQLVDTISSHWADYESLFIRSTERLDERQQKIADETRKIILDVAEKSPKVKDDFFSLMTRQGLPRYRTYEALSLLYDIDPQRATPLLKRLLVSPTTDSHLKETCRALLAEEENALLPTEALIRRIGSLINSDPEFVAPFRNRDQQKRAVSHLREEADRLISLLAKRKMTPSEAIAVLDLAQKNRILDPDGLKPLASCLDKTFQDKDFLAPLVDKLLEQTKRPDWCDIQWQRRLKFLLPNLNELLSETTAPEKIPAIDKLVVLADRIVAARGSILLAAAEKIPSLKQPLTAETSKKLKTLFREVAQGLSPKSLVAVASSARNILGDGEALPFLIELSRYHGPIDEETARVRLAAYQALTPFLAYAQANGAREDPRLGPVIERFHEGLDDDSAAARVYTAQALIGIRDAYVAERLSRQLTAFVRDPAYQTTRRKDPKAFDSTEIIFKQRYKMEIAVAVPAPDGGKPVITTLKNLALQAIFQFGNLSENKELLSTLIAQEELDYVVFGLTPLVQTRLAAMRTEAIGRLAIAIFSRGIREINRLPADRKTEAEKVLGNSVQPIYLMLASPHAEIREQALVALHEADPLGTLANLLRDSKSKNAFARQQATVALKTYEKVFGPAQFAEELKALSTIPTQ